MNSLPDSLMTRVYVLGDALSPGDEVNSQRRRISWTDGCYHQGHARTRAPWPCCLEFLGRQTAVEIPAGSVIKQAEAAGWAALSRNDSVGEWVEAEATPRRL